MFVACYGVMLCTVSIVFFDDTATTEIYTYGHTLSLHDARPISGLQDVSNSRYRRIVRRFLLVASLHGQLHDTYRRAVQDHCNDPAELVGVDRLPRHYVASLRSEEHTSELQSLMRISYAVFCLKKKKQLTTHHNHTTATH